MLRLIMSVAMTLPPFYTFMAWIWTTSVLLTEDFEASGINGSRVLN
jgi:hypothetical protein